MSNSTTVCHCKRDGCDVYIGRRKDTAMHFGNPFTYRKGTAATVVLPSGTDCIAAFAGWLRGILHQDVEPDRRRWILANMENLRGKRLGCWCRTAAEEKTQANECHGDVFVAMLEKER